MKRQDARMKRPYERIKPLSYKPLNTDTVLVKHGSKHRRGDGMLKSTVDCRRINRELHRRKLERASFIPAAFLMNPATGCCVKAVPFLAR